MKQKQKQKEEDNKEQALKEERARQLQIWCARQDMLVGKTFKFIMVSGDASFRRYFRLLTEDASYIAVDAPPDKEDSAQFCKVAELFRQQGCKLPVIHAKDFDAGFMLLEDLGDRLLLSEINEANAQHFYQLSLNQLIKLQRAHLKGNELPLYDHVKLMEEMSLFQIWFLKAYLEIPLSAYQSELIEKTEHLIAETVAQQQQVMVHRDFHSRNIMLLDDGIAMIDFQDALIGPISYDAVSLLKDCYIEWPETRRKQWLKDYFDNLKKENVIQETDFENFYQGFEWMGVQRHLKVLGIFARLSIRDGKQGYLKDLPLTFKYVEEVLQKTISLSQFSEFFVNEVKPLFLKKAGLEKADK